jgi:transposase/IS5 family transposase
MRAIIEADYQQAMLLPACVEDWIGTEHPARYIRELIRSLDLEGLGFSSPDEQMGGKVYSQRLLLGLWLYGYWKRIRSSRKLESACGEEMAFIWLSGNTRPDHNTLWRFWSQNQAGIKRLFQRSVELAMEMGEVELVLSAIDGTKLQAVCAASGRYDKQHNQKLLKRLEKQIEELEKQIQQNADAEQCQPVLSQALREKSRLAQRVKEALAQSEQKAKRYVHPQETDAQRMPINGANRFGYNAQTAVDAKSQIIVASQLVDSANDTQELMPMIEAIKTTTGQVPRQIVADAGYATAAQLQEAHAQGWEVCTPLIGQNQAAAKPYHCSHFRYDPQSDTVGCPQGQLLKFHHQRSKKSLLVRVYRNPAACAQCPVRSLCTQDRYGRAIDIYPWHQFIEQYRQKMLEPNYQALLKRRRALIEPVFAWLKEHAQFRRFSFRGLAKAAVQWAFLCAVHNFKRLAKLTKELAKKPTPALA